MPISLKARLCLMMFLNYVIWGAWYVTIGTYLTATLKFSGTEAGAVFGTTALASMITPFFMGLIADRFLATEKLLAMLHLIGAVILYFVTRATSFGTVYALMLLYCLCYFPTIALTNSLTLRQLTNAGGEFPFIRMFATIGWIAIGVTIGSMGIETTATPFLLAAGVSVAMSLYCLTLPHTPPEGKGQKITVGNLLGLDALVMLKKRPYLVFAVASILACIPLTFYFVFTNTFLNEVGGECRGENDLGPVFGGRSHAVDAVHLPSHHGTRRAYARLGLLEPALWPAGVRQPGRRSMDVLSRHPTARLLL
jgi:nucleoside transporter